MPLTLEALETLDTIARKGSFAAAAAELGKVPSAVTYTIRKLEDELDVLIFDRRGQRARLTGAGRELLDEGRLLLRSADDLARRVHRVANGWEPELRIALDALIDLSALRPLIEDFYREQAPTRLRFSHEVLDGAWEALLDARAELVIGAPHGMPSPALASARFSLRPMGRVDFIFCVAPHHALAKQAQPVTSEAMAQQRAVALADTSRQQSARSTGLLAGQDTLTVATLEQKVAMQIAGLGVGWLPEPIAREHLARGALIALPTIEPRPAAMVHYGWRKADAGKALKWWLSKLELPRVREQLLRPVAVPDAVAPAAGASRKHAKGGRT
jgi:DNA-binding transcriptional LysR family regulator